MKKFLWINIKFENLVRGVVAICTFIAVVIIFFAFYYVFNSDNEENNNFNLDNFANVTNFEATYEVHIYSNKNVNNYSIYEKSDFINDIYYIKVEDGIEILTQGNNCTIKNEGASYSYSYALQENTLNSISFSYIIKNIGDNYSQRETDNQLVYSLDLNSNIYKYYDIFVSKTDKNIEKVCMYNNDGILQILIDNINFEVKK